MTPFNFLLIFALLNVAFAGRHVTLTKEELHWKSVFPNTPMPKVLHDSLPRIGRSTTLTDKVVQDESSDNDYGLIYDDIYSDNSGKESKGTEDDNDYGLVYDDIYGDNSSKKVKGEEAPTNKGNEYNYSNIAAITETIYFFQETLIPSKKVNLPRLTKRNNRALFLRRQIVESMPMSSSKLPEILKSFSLTANSSYAKKVRVVVTNCERVELRGEEKYCATSLESFVDLAVSMLGKNIKLLSHQLGYGLKNPLFTIGRGIKDMGDNNIVCHKMRYPYAIYLCHSIEKTIVYEVPLVSIDGTKANALAVCHKDTSAWSPNHIAFRYLKVKPGSIPICHFLGRDILVWVHN